MGKRKDLSSGMRAALMGTSVLAGLASLFVLAAPAFAQGADAIETVTVTGYRASLADSTNAKRASVSFSDSVFAEDIGKFPDTNIAESLNRIPGVTITRDANGEGVNVSIRGLGTNFTKILLNGNPITVGTTGVIDASNNNRETDLNMFPTELFTQLTVSKTPTADMLEGGAAGTINMRSMRPFDNPGMHISYNAQLTDQSTTNLSIGKRGALVASYTDGPFGILVGVAGVQSTQDVHGWEDGNAGWNTSNLPSVNGVSQCGSGNTCGQFGGGAWTVGVTGITPNTNVIPAGLLVPLPAGFAANTAFTNAFGGPWAPQVVGGQSYFPANYPVTREALLALNPGLVDSSCAAYTATTAPSAACLNTAMTHLSNALLPRLGRPMMELGTKDRYNAIISGEFRPTENLHFYADFIYGRVFNNLNRSDIDWGVRGGNSSTNMIPVGLTLWPNWLADTNTTGGLGGAVQSATLYNAVYGLEARQYKEKGDFFSLNPGMAWQATDMLKIDFQMNYTRSHFLRMNPTIMPTSCGGFSTSQFGPVCPNGRPAGGAVLTFDNSMGDGQPPVQTINLNLNDPNNWEWNLGRVNLNGEKRYTYTTGAHLDVAYGGDKFAIKAGAAYDQAYRVIMSYDISGAWQNAVCGGNPSVYLPGPNGGFPGCTGQASTGAGWVPSNWLSAGQTIAQKFPGYGTGYSAGFPALTFAGSLIPTSQLSNYLVPGKYGFVTVNYEKFFQATNYYPLRDAQIALISCAPNCTIPNPPFGQNSSTGGGTGAYDERTVGFYGKAVGYFDIGDRKLRYDVGLRWIQTRQNIITPVNTTDPRNATLADGGKYPNYFVFQPAKGTYQAFLPALSMVYEVADDFQIRASISRTMNRPYPAAMTGAMQFSDPSVTNASLGNPNLKPYFSNNIDIGAELYTGAEGYIGMTLFRKSISGFTNQVVTQRNFAYLAQYGITWNTLGDQQKLNYQNTGGPSGVPCNSDATCADHLILVTQQQNIKGLEIINGLELDYVQPLDFLTEPYLGVKGFGFTGNMTIIDQKSTGNVPTYATGVAPFQYNATGYYEDNGVMIRMSYNWNDKTYGSQGNAQGVCFPASSSGARPPNCPGGAYLFGYAYGQADVASSLKLSRLFGDLPSDPELTFDVLNVFSAKQKSYLQYPNALHTYYIKGQTYLVGLRGTF